MLSLKPIKSGFEVFRRRSQKKPNNYSEGTDSRWGKSSCESLGGFT